MRHGIRMCVYRRCAMKQETKFAGPSPRREDPPTLTHGNTRGEEGEQRYQMLGCGGILSCALLDRKHTRVIMLSRW